MKPHDNCVFQDCKEREWLPLHDPPRMSLAAHEVRHIYERLLRTTLNMQAGQETRPEREFLLELDFCLVYLVRLLASRELIAELESIRLRYGQCALNLSDPTA